MLKKRHCLRSPKKDSSQLAARHSSEYFGDQRDFWWNQDFLQLMAARWSLDRANKILDVGAGAGHWTRIIAELAPKAENIRGLDRDRQWCLMASTLCADLCPDKPIEFDTGTAEALPYPDSSFDLVTCQTLLIHVPDISSVLGEMRRVLAPGGTLCIVEPNNAARSLADVEIGGDKSLQETIDLVSFQLICEAGKEALGRGNNSAGEKIPGLLLEAGFSNLKIYQSDKCFSLVPPYETAGEVSDIKQLSSWKARDFWIWSKEETKDYFLAGRGSSEDFSRFWELAMRALGRVLANINRRQYVSAGGGVVYLISGTKE